LIVSKLLLIFILCNVSFGFALRDYDQSPRGYSHLAQVISRYDKDELVGTLRNFIKETRPTRIVGSEGHHKASQFIIDFVKKHTDDKSGIMVVDDFVPNIDRAIKLYQDDLKTVQTAGDNVNKAELMKWTNFTNSRVSHLEKLRSQKGKNIVWEKRGSKFPNEVIVLGAHYDTIAYDKKTLSVLPEVAQPGADNNGSGVAMGLGLIQLLSELKIERTVRVVFFDFQEFGFLGSWDYAKKLSEEVSKGLKLYSYVNLLMLGHDSKIQDTSKRYGNMNLYISEADGELYERERKISNEAISLGSHAMGNVKFDTKSIDFKNGDVTSFKEFKLPGITFTQDWESDFNGKRIHTSSDFVETLNFKTFYDSFRFIGQFVSSWALNLSK